MKTPEEIKKGLECCQTIVRCGICPYHDIGEIAAECTATLTGDALELIKQLEFRLAQAEKDLAFKEKCLEWRYNDIAKAADLIDDLNAKLAQAERERDAAVRDMENYCHHGSICRHFADDCPNFVEGCPLYPSDCKNYEWRGVCAENTEEE